MGEEEVKQAQIFAFLLLWSLKFKLPGGGDQFLQVFHPCFSFLTLFLFVKLD